MYANYRDSHKRHDKGVSYDNEFQKNPHRSLVWELERKVLDDILRRFMVARLFRHLDFACGTGRIIAYLEDRMASSYGVDISPSMLDVAKKKVKRATIIEADLTRNDVLGDHQFDLITAFRFFPNAEYKLRFEVINVLMKHLTTDGYLVFNNHKNDGSLLNRIGRFFGRDGYNGMPNNEVDELLKLAGLKVEKVYPIGFMPATELRLILPQSLLRPIENAALELKIFPNLAQDLVFVCRRL
ncbi:MAG: class I SAM-dependent methyltransferase [Proteobacteria bacterium]|nr:class I SAM-dependent methyltransferase [Pseudomonadota bacterium]